MAVTGTSVQEIQERIIHMQRQLEQETVCTIVGGVTVVVTGCLRVQSIDIAPSAFVANDFATVQTQIAQAVNEALDKARSMAQARMNALSGTIG